MAEDITKKNLQIGAWKLSLVLFCLTLNGQMSAQTRTLDSYFSQIRSGKFAPSPAEANKPENAEAFLNALPVYLKDTVAMIRLRAVAISNTIGYKSRVSSIRTKAVEQIINAANDPVSGNSGAALSYLTRFRKSDFSKISKDALKTLLIDQPVHLDIIVKIVGYLEVPGTTGDLYAIAQNTVSGRKERWSAMLALARMGDQLAAEDIIRRVERMPVTDEVVYQIFPDLVYTRNRAAISILINALNSDAKNCESADAERGGKIPCAYRVMEMLAPAIENYPLQLDESGDIKTTDYPGALQIVRNWFKEHPDYKISKDRF